MNIEDIITLFLNNQGGQTVIESLVSIGFANSKSDAKRAIEQNSVSLGNCKVVDTKSRIYNIDGSIVLVQTAKDGKIDITTKLN